MTKTTNNQQRTLFKTKPNKANLHFTAENAEYAEKKYISVSDCSIEKYALYAISPCSGIGHPVDLRTRRLMKNKAKTKPRATIFNLIKKLTTDRTDANLKGYRIIWRSGCFWTWGIGTYFLGDRRMESHTKRKLNIKNQS
ncbi:MAG: hypothetical protein ACYS0I_21770, partial [Planctomycetota bacterium]